MPTDSIASPFDPYRLAGLTLRNRVIKSATYEGMTIAGRPTRSLREFHRDVARGGAAMTTVAYCSVSPDGRTFRDQLFMHDEVVPALRTLTDAVHAEGAAASIQLGHCGGFCNNHDLRRRRPLGPSRGFNALGALSGRPRIDAMSSSDIEEVTGEFVAAAKHAREAGFDAVEIHVGHGYLLSQFLSPATNHRTDEYGGSIENRLRFPIEVVRRVREALPASMPVLVKTNLRDGFRGGLEIDEATEVVRGMERAGADAAVLSGGFVSRDAMYLFRGERPLSAMISVEKHWPQKIALALFGPAVVKRYPFEPLFFLPLARVVRNAVRLPLVLLGGITSRDDMDTAMREGFELVAMARALVHDPQLIAKLARGELTRSGCEPCNLCVAEMDRAGGVACAHQPAQIERRAKSLPMVVE